MASLMRQLQSRAAVATEFAAKHGSTFYKRLLEENKQYIQQEPTVQKCQELSKQLFYTRLASLPGRYDALWKEVDYVKQKIFARNDLKLEELGIAALFLGECYAWFCVGEIVGRGGTLTGYKVDELSVRDLGSIVMKAQKDGVTPNSSRVLKVCLYCISCVVDCQKLRKDVYLVSWWILLAERVVLVLDQMTLTVFYFDGGDQQETTEDMEPARTLKLFIGVNALWTSPWVWCGMVPVVRHGHVKSCPDEDIQSSVVEVMGRNVESNYITCPHELEEVLAIDLPILVLIIKNMRKYFAFEVHVLDDKNIIRQLRADNRQLATQVVNYFHFPIKLDLGWNQFQLNLADFTKKAYGTNYVETLRVQIHANCRIRHIYFTDQLHEEEELLPQYKLFLPIQDWLRNSVASPSMNIYMQWPYGKTQIFKDSFYGMCSKLESLRLDGVPAIRRRHPKTCIACPS